MGDVEVIEITMYVFCSLSMVLYLFVFITLWKRKGAFITSLISFQLAITCVLHSGSYFIPSRIDTPCLIQASLKVFGEISKLTIATIVLFLSQLNFLNKENVGNKKVIYLIISVCLIWILPIIIGVVCVFFGKAGIYCTFCFINTPQIVFCFVPIRYGLIIMFFFLAFKLVRDLNKSYTNTSIDESYTIFLARIKRYCILMGINTLFVFSYLILDIIRAINPKNHAQLTIPYGIIDILDSLTSPAFVLVLLFDKNKWKILKNTLLCRETEDDDEKLDEEGEKIRRLTLMVS